MGVHGTHVVKGLLKAAAASEAGVPEPRPQQRRDAAQPKVRHFHDAIPCRYLCVRGLVYHGWANTWMSVLTLTSIAVRTPKNFCLHNHKIE